MKIVQVSAVLRRIVDVSIDRHFHNLRRSVVLTTKKNFNSFALRIFLLGAPKLLPLQSIIWILTSPPHSLEDYKREIMLALVRVPQSLHHVVSNLQAAIPFPSLRKNS